MDGGEWVRLNSVANAVAHLKTKGAEVFHTQVTQTAEKGGTQKGVAVHFPRSQPLENRQQPKKHPEINSIHPDLTKKLNSDLQKTSTSKQHLSRPHQKINSDILKTSRTNSIHLDLP